MELLLGSLVYRLLARFVVSAGGESGSTLRVSLSAGGTVVLKSLELNLDPLLGRLPLRVKRAYAQQLQISIPWTALATQPIQVCFLCAKPQLEWLNPRVIAPWGCATSNSQDPIYVLFRYVYTVIDQVSLGVAVHCRCHSR